MAWNEPGGDKKDPWSRGSGSDGPPDLDEIMRKMRDRFGGLFGGGKGGGFGRIGGIGVGIIIVVIIVLWLLSGFYVVAPEQRGVLLRFGAAIGTVQPGLGWRIPPPVDTIIRVDVKQIYREQYRSQMLTRDENIVAVDLAAQYKIFDPEEYLFFVQSPNDTLQYSMESALREVVGSSTMDYVLTEGRTDVAQKTQDLLQETLNRYKSGLKITKVNLQDAQPPEPVQGAFADAIKAREDEQRYMNEAEAYKAEKVKRAEGSAYDVRKQAEAYAIQVMREAEGEASRFSQVLTEYKKAPKVTRDRLYLEAVEGVLANNSKVIVDVKGGNNLLYLPLDKLITLGGAAIASEAGNQGAVTRSGQPDVGVTRSRDSRSRGYR